MKDLHWEDMPLEKRMEVFNTYSAHLLKKEGIVLDFEQVDACWTGSRWITIYYAFGVAEYLR